MLKKILSEKVDSKRIGTIGNIRSKMKERMKIQLFLKPYDQPQTRNFIFRYVEQSKLS